MYRYIGNKTRLTGWLIRRINELAPRGSVVADPMCGTGAVAEALRESGYRVIASDLMTYAVHHARVRLLLHEAPHFAGLGRTYQDILNCLNGLEPLDGFYHREYSPEGVPLSGDAPRKYLTPRNAGKLDAINRQLNEWMLRGEISTIENSLLRHDLVLAVNRIANIAGTYGHFRSTFSKASEAELGLNQSTFLTASRSDHKVLQGPAEEIAHEISADVCYIDPPYMKRQYAANYHLIETIARGDEPEAIGVSGLRPWRDQYSVFCTRTRIQHAFRQIVQNADCPVFLISYSSDGLLKDEELSDLFDPLGDVSIERRAFPRFKSNQSSLSPHVCEYLITLTKADYVRKPEQHAVGAN